MLPSLNNISSQQAHPTTQVKEKLQTLMDYANTYPNIYFRYYASNMQLHVDTDAAYLVLPKARSRIAGYFRLLGQDTTIYDHNGAILIECKTLRNVVTSAAEVETHGIFHNAKQTLPIRHILTELGHKQLQPTPIKTDNSTSAGYVNKNIQIKRSKTWDIYLHWLCDKEKQKKFQLFGTKEAITKQIISQNISQLFITEKSEILTCMSETKTSLTCDCKGVLIWDSPESLNHILQSYISCWTN